jgi:hypothetical protein
MKRDLALAVLVFGVLVSCKKSNPAGGVTNFDSQHLTCAIDGVATNFNANLVATRTTTTTPSGPYTQIVVEGYSTQIGKGLPGLGLGWNNSTANVTFGIGTWIDTSSKYYIYSNYIIDSVHGWAAGTPVWQTTVGTGINITNDFVLNITYYDNTEVKGTFSGAYYEGSVSAGNKKLITNGDFVVRWK